MYRGVGTIRHTIDIIQLPGPHVHGLTHARTLVCVMFVPHIDIYSPALEMFKTDLNPNPNSNLTLVLILNSVLHLQPERTCKCPHYCSIVYLSPQV